MPSKSISQQHLFQAAEHGADFPMAKKIRSSMTHDQMHDFAVGSESGKPGHVSHHSPPASTPNEILKGNSRDIIGTNTKTLMNTGMKEVDATKKSIRAAKGYNNVHERLGKFLHPRKDGKPHGSDTE